MAEDQNQNPPPIGPPGGPASIGSPCARCGQVHARCIGHSNRSGGGPCGQHPVTGLRVCWSHGGASKHARKAGARRVAVEKAAAAVRSLGLRDDRPADEILLDELAWAAGHVAWLRGKVQELEPERLTWGVTEEVHKTATEFSGVDTTSAAVPSIWWVLYREAQKHLLEVLKVIKGFDLDERRLEFARAQVAPQIAVVIDQFVRALGLTPEQAGRVPAALEAAVRSFLTGPKVIEGSAA